MIYEDGNVELATVVKNESTWLSQKQIAELFDVQRTAIAKQVPSKTLWVTKKQL